MTSNPLFSMSFRQKWIPGKWAELHVKTDDINSDISERLEWAMECLTT